MTIQFGTVGKLFGLVVFAAEVGLSPASGATATTIATMDAMATTGPTGNLANNNYGAAGALAISAAGLSRGESQSVLQFDLSGVATAFDAQFGVAQWSVQSVSLQLTASSPNNPIFNTPAAGSFGASRMQNDAWLEGTGTPSAPGSIGISFSSLQNTFISAFDESVGTFSFDGATSGEVNYSLGLTPNLVGDIVSGSPLSLRLFATDDNVSAVFNSRNFSTPASRPVLTIEVVPEPGVVVFAAVGIGWLSACKFWNRRRRA